MDMSNGAAAPGNTMPPPPWTSIGLLTAITFDRATPVGGRKSIAAEVRLTSFLEAALRQVQAHVFLQARASAGHERGNGPAELAGALEVAELRHRRHRLRIDRAWKEGDVGGRTGRLAQGIF